jgi:pyruvate/2-oxoglutarate dehydrogenase complex dihydrolipoamide dehydrogenase (E3) component
MNRVESASRVAPGPPAGGDGLAVLPDDEHNRDLVAHVHPRSWSNPRPDGRYNLVVIGGGTAGLVSAMGAAGLGARVALVERQLLGGDCLVHGCIPSKAVIRAARAAFDAQHSAPFGVRAANAPSIDFATVMERMRRLRAGIARHDSAERFASGGVDVYFGDARFVSRDEVEVQGERLRFARAVIATGGRPRSLSIPGAEETRLLSNETVFSLTSLPERMAIIGAGPIGSELAQAFRRFGSQVTLLGSHARVLPHEDPDASIVLEEQLRNEAIELALGARVTGVGPTSGGRTVTFDRGRGPETIMVDEILVAIGRAPNVEGLGLESAQVAFDERGVRVDDHLRTTNPRIYAAGDVCSPYKFTHAADAMARVALQNALFMGRKKVSSLVIPWTTYTDPEIAHVGVQEREAKERGLLVETLTVPLAEIDRAVLDGETAGFACLHVDPRGGRILGATVVARHAGEMLGEVVLAMTEGLPAGALSRTVHAYPTQAEVWKRLGDAYNRTRLKPWILRLFERYFHCRR